MKAFKRIFLFALFFFLSTSVLLSCSDTDGETHKSNADASVNGGNQTEPEAPAAPEKTEPSTEAMKESESESPKTSDPEETAQFLGKTWRLTFEDTFNKARLDPRTRIPTCST